MYKSPVTAEAIVILLYLRVIFMFTLQQRKRLEGWMIFAVGGAVYTAAEILWRGYSHWTMTLTGGACAALIHLANRRMNGKSFILRCCAGCGIITTLEFTVGCIVNLWLGWNVWDYSGMRFNLLGQICLLYSIMWLFMSIPAIALSTWFDSRRRPQSYVVFS